MSETTEPRQGGSPFTYNPQAPGFDSNPHPMFARLREEAPVYYWEPAGAWLVSRFEDVATVLRDPRFTLNPVEAGRAPTMGSLPPALAPIFGKILTQLAPKDHLRVRRAVTPALTPRAVDRLRPDIQRIIDAALVPWEGKDEIDIAVFSDYIPLRVIASMLGLSQEHDETFRRFGQAIVRSIDSRLTPAQKMEVLAPVPAGIALFQSIIAERRKNLGEDLLSTLIRAEEAGDKLSEDEMLSLVTALVTGGSETTVHFINFSMLNLLRAPEVLAQVRADPALLKSALEEVLRWDSFGKGGGLQRFALEDVELSGVKLPRGSAVMVLLSAAQRDPRAYPNADTFDPKREPDERIHFGLGAHYCLGANLARVECEMAVSTLLKRYPYMKLAAEPVYSGHPILRDMQSLRVSVKPPAA